MDTCTCPEHGNWISAGDVHPLVRRIDVALNGEDGAAQQALLCDIVSQVEHVVRKSGRPILEPNVPAQPSPAGQGDALASLPLYRLADDANGKRGLHRDDTGSWVKLQDVERALAARQPVGEVVEYQSYHGYGGGQWSRCDKKLYDNGKAFEAKYGSGQMSLYRALVVGDAAPPAQAVDLYRLCGPGDLLEPDDEFLMPDATWKRIGDIGQHQLVMGAPYNPHMSAARRKVAG